MTNSLANVTNVHEGIDTLLTVTGAYYIPESWIPVLGMISFFILACLFSGLPIYALYFWLTKLKESAAGGIKNA